MHTLIRSFLFRALVEIIQRDPDALRVPFPLSLPPWANILDSECAPPISSSNVIVSYLDNHLYSNHEALDGFALRASPCFFCVSNNLRYHAQFHSLVSASVSQPFKHLKVWLAPHTSHLIMRSELPVLSLILAVLLAVSLLFRSLRSNFTTLCILLWLLVCSIIHGVNSAVWESNTVARIPVWCDIGTRLYI